MSMDVLCAMLSNDVPCGALTFDLFESQQPGHADYQAIPSSNAQSVNKRVTEALYLIALSAAMMQPLRRAGGHLSYFKQDVPSHSSSMASRGLGTATLLFGILVCLILWYYDGKGGLSSLDNRPHILRGVSDTLQWLHATLDNQ